MSAFSFWSAVNVSCNLDNIFLFQAGFGAGSRILLYQDIIIIVASPLRDVLGKLSFKF